MDKRIGLSATGLSVAAGIILAIYEVMGWKMPEPVAIALIIITSLAGLIALVVFCHAVTVWAKPKLGKYRLRLHDRTKPEPNQWLINIAQHDAENPQGELREITRTVSDMNLDPSEYRPWIEISFKFFNGGVHTILIGPANGRPNYKGTQLPDEVVFEGRIKLVRGATSDIKLKVYLPPAKAKEIFENEISVEVAHSFRRIRSLNFSGVKLKIESEPEGGYIGTTSYISLGGDNTILVGNSN